MHEAPGQPPFPAPPVAPHVIDPETLWKARGYGPADIFTLATRYGWHASAVAFAGHVPDAAWMPKQVTFDRPRFTEDGTPELTPTGLHAVEKVPTGELVVEQTLVLRAAILWEREAVVTIAVWHEQAFHRAWSHGTRRHLEAFGVRELRHALARRGAPADLHTEELAA